VESLPGADRKALVAGVAGRELSDTLKKKLLKAGVTKVDVLLPPGRSESPLIKNTPPRIRRTPRPRHWRRSTRCCAPARRPNIETAREALKRLFFHPSVMTWGGSAATRSTSGSR